MAILGRAGGRPPSYPWGLPWTPSQRAQGIPGCVPWRPGALMKRPWAAAGGARGGALTRCLYPGTV